MSATCPDLTVISLDRTLLLRTDRTLKPQRPVVSSKLPEACFFDRTRPVHLDRTQTASGAQPLATVPPSQRDRTQAVSVRCFWIQRPVTGPTPASFRSTPFQLLLLHPCSSVPTTKNFASGAIENRHFIFPTHLNPTNTLCTCGSIFTQILSRVLALH